MKACFVLAMLFGLLAIVSARLVRDRMLPRFYPRIREVDICSLDIEAGPCMALFHRYGFSPEKGECVEFSYGGCQGNMNNFETMEECRRMCHGRRFNPWKFFGNFGTSH
ncbi:Kunitz/Bovine pancreatic trypsin inhibitor domain protein [Cooperia oncophora]